MNVFKIINYKKGFTIRILFHNIKVFFHNIKVFFRGIKFMFQRATKGYCDYDLYELDTFYRKLFISSLTEFASKTDSCPDTLIYSEWIEILNRIITLLKESDYTNSENCINKYQDDLDKLLENVNIKDFLDGNLSEENLKIKKEFFDEEINLSNIRNEKQKEALSLLSEYFNELWW